MFSRKNQAKAHVVDDNGKQVDPTVNQIHHGSNKATVMVENCAVIPNHPTAKLMYYLHCVRNCVDLEISSRLVDFKNYYLLTELERRDVVAFAHRFRPRVLCNVIFFEVSDDSYLLPKSSNNFLAFDDPVVIGSFKLASNPITVDGVQQIIKRIMLFKYGWVHDYFEVPFGEEKWRIGLAPRRMYFVSRNHDPVSAIDVPVWCAGGIIVCFIFPPVGLALIAVGACRAGCELARCDEPATTTTYVVY